MGGLPDAKFFPLLNQHRNDDLESLVNIWGREGIHIRELAATVKSVVGYQGTIEFDDLRPDGTPRKSDGCRQAECHGVAGANAHVYGLTAACQDFLAFRG